MASPCLRCSQDKDLRARGLCRACYLRSTADGSLHDYSTRVRSRPEVVEEVEALLPSRGAQDTAIALGMTPAAIARACYRAGRADLARPFGRLANAARYGLDRINR